MNHSGHSGMMVLGDWQGEGLGTKLVGFAVNPADDWLGLTRLDLCLLVNNDVAIALYR